MILSAAMKGLKKYFATIIAVLFLQESKSSVVGPDVKSVFTQSIKTNTVRCEYDLRAKVANCSYRQLRIVPQQLIQDVQGVDLSYNSIEKLKNNSLILYPMLTYLDLSYNNLMLIEQGAFYSLKRLKALSINGNPRLLLLGAEIFLGLENLFELSLAECNLTWVPKNLLTYCPSLKDLDLSYNQLRSINLTSKVRVLESLDLTGNLFNNLCEETVALSCTVESILMGHNPMRFINPNMSLLNSFQELTLTGRNFSLDTWTDLFVGVSHSRIQKLVVQFGSLPDVPANIFTPLIGHRLHLLDLSFNSIKKLHPYGFRNLSIISLNLSNNHIEKFEPEYLSGIVDLVTVNLNENFIAAVNPLHSIWNSDLENMILSYNNLRDIDQYTFRGLKNLRTLDLKDNKFLISVHFESGIENLEVLDMSGGSISSLSLFLQNLKYFSMQTFNFGMRTVVPGETFNMTKSIEKIDITQSLSFHDFRDDDGRYLFDDLQNLTHLVLSDNNFQYLLTGAFYRLSSLESLDLRRCLTRFICKYAFFGLTSLRTLSLQHNHLHVPPPHDVFPKLTHLFLHDNSLGYLEEDQFTYSSFLIELTLANNIFKSFNQTTLTALNASGISVDISGNPLDCDCGLAWFVEWLKGSVKVSNKQNIFCSLTNVTIKELRGKNIAMFDARRLCGPDASSYISIFLAIITLLLLIVTVYYHRWFIRYKFLLLKMAILGYQEIRQGHVQRGFEFDLNVMFIDDDEYWVREHLRPTLEERLPQFERKAIGDDALLLGMHYLDAVHHVVQNSFKTVLLISRAAVRENWFLIKFRIALDNVVNTQEDNIVLIFLEDIPGEDLPYLVRHYLSEQRPYLRWTGDERGREYFWNELVTILSVNFQEGNVRL